MTTQRAWTWIRPTRIDLSRRGDALEWTRTGQGPGFVEVQRTRPLLGDFVALATDETGRAVRDFARRWGLLDLRRIGWGEGMAPDHSAGWIIEASMRGRESVAAWRELASVAGAVLDMAEGLRSGVGQDARARAVLNSAYTEAPSFGGGKDAGRLLVQQIVNDWLGRDLVLTQLAWTRSARRLETRPQSLFGALALELAGAVEGVERALRRACRGCGEPFAVEGRRVYCRACRPRAGGSDPAQRDASRRYRARVADARARVAAGESVVAVAKSIGKPVPQVRGWIS